MKKSAQERSLLDFAERVCRNTSPYYAAFFRLEKLADNLNSDALIGMLRFSIENFAKNNGGQCFTLIDNKVMLVCESGLRLKVNRFIMDIEDTLPDSLEGITGQASIVELYDIHATPNLFLKCCQHLYEDALEQEEADKQTGGTAGQKAAPTPITGQLLDRIKVTLESCDISPIIRRQHICALSDGKAPKPLFMEYFVSMMALSESIAPGVSVTANMGLFRELTRALDHRFLSLLRDEYSNYLNGPASFNLNMSTLKEGAFLHFLEEILPQSDRSLIVELDFMDVLENLHDYLTVIPFLRKKGLKILIENLRPALLDVVDIKELEADLLKIRWQAHYSQIPLQRELFCNALTRLPVTRCILTHCDSQQAIAMGQRAGLQAFQGYQVDSMVTARRETEAVNTFAPSFPEPVYS